MAFFPDKVTIVEVGPRDGLQNEKVTISTDTKIEFINQLSETGLSVIEATSFVSPKWIPQLADHADVFKGIHKKPGIDYPVLVPNVDGLENAIKSGVKSIAVFTTPSETFSEKNTHCSVSDSLARIHDIIIEAKRNNIKIRGYLSCVLGCPYEGDISVDAVIRMTEQLLVMGCYEVSLGDTIGVGTPIKTQILLESIKKSVGLDHMAVHFHDTYGQALTNIYVALGQGVRVIDSSIAGLGGCPYAKGASGNVATEDVVYMLNGMGIQSGIDLEKLSRVGQFITNELKCETRSKVALCMRS